MSWQNVTKGFHIFILIDNQQSMCCPNEMRKIKLVCIYIINVATEPKIIHCKMWYHVASWRCTSEVTKSFPFSFPFFLYYACFLHPLLVFSSIFQSMYIMNEKVNDWIIYNNNILKQLAQQNGWFITTGFCYSYELQTIWFIVQIWRILFVLSPFIHRHACWSAKETKTFLIIL